MPRTLPGREGSANMFRTGLYYNGAPDSVAAGTGTRFNGQCTAHPFIVDVDSWAFDRIAMEVTGAATAGGIYRLGIAADTGTAYPGAIILDAGTVDVTTTGIKEITVSPVLTRGVWWLLAVQQGSPGTVATVVRVPAPSNAAPFRPVGKSTAGLATGDSGFIATTGFTGAFPATFETGLVPGGGMTQVNLRAA